MSNSKRTVYRYKITWHGVFYAGEPTGSHTTYVLAYTAQDAITQFNLEHCDGETNLVDLVEPAP